MKSFLNSLLGIFIAIALPLFGFCIGAYATGWACVLWVVPRWAKEYPHDGQLGLGVLGYAFFGGIVGAIAAIALGIYFSVRLRRNRGSNQKESI